MSNTNDIEILGNFDLEEKKIKRKVKKMVADGVIKPEEFESVFEEENQKFFEESRYHSLNGKIYPFCVGGSDAAIVLGISKWKSPQKLYYEKTRIMPTPSPSESQQLIFKIGHAYEASARTMFTYISGLQTEPCNIQIRNMKYPHCVANIDGVVWENGKMGIYEGKTTRAYTQTRKDFEADIVPDYYMTQIQFYMELWGLDFAYINCIWGIYPEQMKYIRVDHDPEYAKLICTACEEFVINASYGIKPATTCQYPSVAAKDAIEIYGKPVKHSSPLTLSSHECDTLKQYSKLVNEKKDLEEKIAEPVKRIKDIDKNMDSLLKVFPTVMEDNSQAVATVDGEEYEVEYSVKEGYSMDAEVKNIWKDKYPDIFAEITSIKPTVKPTVKIKKAGTYI